MLAAIVAVLSPLRDILSRDPLAAITPKRGLRGGRTSRSRARSRGVLCLAGGDRDPARARRSSRSSGMVAADRRAAAAARRRARRWLLALLRTPRAAGSPARSPHVAAMELSAARARAIGVAATGAVAVFGAVAIQGAHADLLHGPRERGARRERASPTSGSPRPAPTTCCAPRRSRRHSRRTLASAARACARCASTAAACWTGATRRVWVIAPPRAADAAAAGLADRRRLRRHGATARLRAGGWAVLSQALADEHHLHIGSTRHAALARARRRVRVAALSTNIGWAPGAVIMSAARLRAGAGAASDASAYNVLARRRARRVARSPARSRARSGPTSGLSVQSAAAHAAEQNALSRQGLQRLTQIATLILAVAVLAMAAAIGNMVWQRRPRLAKLKLEGFPARELWRTILLESALLLARRLPDGRRCSASTASSCSTARWRTSSTSRSCTRSQ